MSLLSARCTYPPARPTINQDVWLEILRYFRISLTEDKEDEIRAKRATLFSAALSCSAMADPALDELWRSMTSLEAVLGVINEVADGTSRALAFVEESGDNDSICESWDLLLSPPQRTKYLLRIQKNLRRVRYLHFDRWPSDREFGLWQSLAAQTRTPVVCPNLKSLSLDMYDLQDGYLVSARCLFFILSSTLETLTLRYCAKGQKVKAAHLLLRMLRSHETPLLEITYHGYIDGETFRLISEFPSLRSIKIREYLAQEDDLSGFLEIEDFKNLKLKTSLTTIEFNLDSVAAGDDRELGPSLTSLEALYDLTVRGSKYRLECCIFNHGLAFKVVQSLTLISTSSTPPDGAALFTHILQQFPRLHSLGIELAVRRDNDEAQLHQHEFVDITQLHKRSMRRIKLFGVPIHITANFFSDVSSKWAELEELSLEWPTNQKPNIDVKAVLNGFSSNATHLRTLGLPLDMKTLARSPLSIPTSHLRCPLRTLNLTPPWKNPLVGDIPMIARNLMTLFPRLTTVDVDGERSPELWSLQTTLTTMREMMISPPGRPDSLFYALRLVRIENINAHSRICTLRLWLRNH
ncbi:hypothetical protein NP233_g7469 [Leucocoprinus birnbaumii]|uniref:Uncharacterized protein n=1 Tax=Leucocoprinus birnbaumii TaxID=56174 RepID=A0AAD5VUM4_9AGAR|nr:hypothetical protein NP233_g7469 [Leucocoprinus birnbaumii]